MTDEERVLRYFGPDWGESDVVWLIDMQRTAWQLVRQLNEEVGPLRAECVMWRRAAMADWGVPE